MRYCGTCGEPAHGIGNFRGPECPLAIHRQPYEPDENGRKLPYVIFRPKRPVEGK
jgi:hypothetical protein